MNEYIGCLQCQSTGMNLSQFQVPHAINATTVGDCLVSQSTIATRQQWMTVLNLLTMFQGSMGQVSRRGRKYYLSFVEN